MIASKELVETAYQRYGRNYDLAVKFYRLIGLHIEDYRLRAVNLLRLKQGDSVIDLGCGTGLNFPLLIQKIGPEGLLIGVDLSSEMLACAEERVERFNWDNVRLIHSDMAVYDMPKGVAGVMSSGVFGYVRERDRVVEKISQAIAPGGRFVILDGKRPDPWPLWLFKLFVWFSSPFGITQAYFDNHAWESVEHFFKETTFEEAYGGLIYISAGTAT